MTRKVLRSLVATVLLVCMCISSVCVGFAAPTSQNAAEGSRLMDLKPSGWAQPTIEAAQDYSDLFNLTWRNKYTDSITRGQFGILIDYVIYSKTKEFPEFTAYLEKSCHDITGATTRKFYAKMEQVKESVNRNETGAQNDLATLMDYEMMFRAKATQMLAKRYPDIEWIAKYADVLTESRITHFNDTQVTIAPYCEIIYNAGIANGTSNTTFEPNLNITREQAAVMMYNLTQFLGLEAGVREMQFADDADISNWAKAAIYRISVIESSELGGTIMAGIGDNKFGPKSNLTIEQGLVMIYRLATIL